VATLAVPVLLMVSTFGGIGASMVLRYTSSCVHQAVQAPEIEACSVSRVLKHTWQLYQAAQAPEACVVWVV
jgi:hypothetical protein